MHPPLWTLAAKINICYITFVAYDGFVCRHLDNSTMIGSHIYIVFPKAQTNGDMNVCSWVNTTKNKVQ